MNQSQSITPLDELANLMDQHTRIVQTLIVYIDYIDYIDCIDYIDSHGLCNTI